MCGQIGSSDEDALTPVMAQLFYLNTANPAPCSGNITSWRVCYYGPDDVQFASYWATYAVYRRIGSGSNEHYEKVSGFYRAVTANRLLSIIDTTNTVDGEIQAEGFTCYDDYIDNGDSPITIQAGDVLGACIFDPVDASTFDRFPLNIVGQSSTGQYLLRMSSSACTRETLPTTIPSDQLSTISSRRLHLYANIGKTTRSNRG